MLLDHSQQTGAPRDFTIDDETYPVSGLTPYQLGQLEAYLRDAVPDPLEEVRTFLRGNDVFTAEDRKVLIADACRRREPQYDPTGFQVGGWPITFNSHRGQQVLFNGQGIAHFLWVVLSKHTPTLTRQQATRLAARIGVEDLARLSELIAVKDPRPEADDGSIATAPGDPVTSDSLAGYCNPNS